jgi:hypothetical protein
MYLLESKNNSECDHENKNNSNCDTKNENKYYASEKSDNIRLISSSKTYSIACFPHIYIEHKDTKQTGLQKIKFNYLYKKNDGTHTNKGILYDQLPTINSHFTSRGLGVGYYNQGVGYYNIITIPIVQTTVVTTPNQTIDLTQAKDTKGNILSNFLPPIYNQGGYGTCTANATAMIWNILKLIGGNNIKYTNGVYNTVFTQLTILPSRSSIYYNGRAISGLLIETIDSTNKTIADRLYVDEGTDPSLFGSIFASNGVPTNIDDTLISGGAFNAISNGRYTTYHYYGGQTITGICAENKWSYPVDATYTINNNNDPYPYCNPYFLLYNSASSNGEYDASLLVPSNSSVTTIENSVNSKVSTIQNTVKTISGTYNILPNKSLFTLYLSPLHTVATPSSVQSQITSSTFYTTLQQGLPMLLGFNVYSNFYNTPSSGSTAGIVPPISGSLLGGHCIVVVGWVQYPANSGQYYVKCMNSWGVSWGNNGYCYFTLSIFTDKRTDTSLYAFVSAQ